MRILAMLAKTIDSGLGGKRTKAALQGMTIAAPPLGLQPEDYEEIEAAVMETARGRWFLSEYARRLRAAGADRLIAAIERLERRLLLSTRDDAALTPEAAPRSAPSLAERLQDFAWALRERGVDEYVCAEVEAIAREAPHSAAPTDESGEHAREAVVESARAEVALAAPSPTPSSAIGEAQAPAPEAPSRPEAESIDPRLVALSRLDRLPLAEKFALFG
jgi:hypothetical protein